MGPKGLGAGIAFNRFGPVVYFGDGNYTRILDDKFIKEITDSIDSVYEYLYGSEENNKLYNIVRMFFLNNQTTCENMWQKLFDYLIKGRKIGALEGIHWKEGSVKGNIDTIIQSIKSINNL